MRPDIIQSLKNQTANLNKSAKFNTSNATEVTNQGNSQYDEGYLLGMDSNEYRANQQTWSDKLGNGMVNMAGSAFTGALESTVGLGVGITSAFVDGEASSFYNNSFGQWIDQFNEATRELAPFYQTEEEQNMSLGASLGTSNFWFDKVLGGAGYTIGSLATGYGLNSLFKLSTKTAAGMISSADDAMAVLNNTNKAAKGIERLEMAKQFGIGMIMAHGESAMEARQTYNESIEKLTFARDQAKQGNPEFAQYNNLTDDQIKTYSEDAANSNYLMNLAITGPTDMMLLGKWINPGTKEAVEQYAKASERIGSEIVEGTKSYFDKLAKQKGRAFLKGSEAFLKGFATEGGQEGGQFASNVASQEFVKNFQINDEGRLSSIISGLGEGIKETLTTREGLENILVGGITGGAFGMKGFLSQKNAEDLATKQLVENLNKDIDFNKQGADFGSMFGKTDTAVQSVSDKIKSINYNLSIAERAKLENDLFTAFNAEENALSQYIKMHIDKGTDEFLKEKLELLKTASPEEMATFFGVTDKTTPDKYAEKIDKIISNIDQHKKLNDTLYRVYGISGGTKEEKIQNQNLRDRLFYASVNIDNVQKRIDSISKGLEEITFDSGMKGLSLINLRDTAINSVTSTSLDKLNKQAKELGLDYSKYLKEYKDDAFKEYNDSLKKLLENDPLKATEIIDMLADLNKLHERKQQFVDYYNALNDPKKATELLNVEQDLQKKHEKKINAALEFQKGTTEAIDDINKNDFFKVDSDRSNVKVIGDKEIDVAKLTQEELVNLKLSLEQDLKNIDKQVREGEKTKEILDKETQLQNELASIINELKFKGNKQKTIDEYVDRLNKTKDIQEIFKILKEAEDKGISINQTKVDELIGKFDKLAKDFNNKLKDEEEPFVMNMNFKGVQEFSRMIFLNDDAKKSFEQLKNQGDFLDKIEFVIKDNKDEEPDRLRDIGIGANAHSRLKKRIPPFTINVVHKDNKDTVLGYLPYYDQYWDMKNNKAVVFESLSEQEFRNIFSPGKEYPDYTIEQMKMARLANKSIYDKVQASNKQRLNNTEVKAILDITLTRGNFNTVDPLEDLTPLNKLPIHKINGVPVIVDLVLFNGTASILPMMGLSTMNENGEIVFPELYEKTVKKLSQIARNNVSNPLNSKYWALVEDKVGQVEHEGKKYTWVPITSNQLSTERKDIVFNRLKEIRNKLISNQFKTEQEFKDELSALNNMFFLSMHDTSGYTSDQKSFLSVSKGSDKFPAGNVALKIEYKITGQKGEAWFNFDISKVNSFDEMIAEVEKVRTHSKVKAHQDLSGLQPLTPRSIRENLGKFDKINPNERDIMNEFGAMVRENYLINQSILFNGKTYNPSIPKSKEETKENVADLIEEDDEEESISTISPKNINDEPSNLPAQNKANTLVISNTRGKVDLNQKPNDTVLNRTNISLATPVSYVQAIEDIKGMLPSFINVEELSVAMQNIADGRITFGSFSNYTVRLANGIPNGTQFHETFHAVFRTMLSNEQQDIVYAEAKDLLRKSLGSKSFNQAFKEFKAEHDEYSNVKSEKELEAIFIEEFLADQFKDWVVNKEKSLVYKEAKAKGLFKSIIDFFKNILNFAKWFDGNTDLVSLFSSIEAGKFKDAEVIRNRFTKDGRVVYSQIFAGNFNVDGEQIDDYLDANIQERLINTIVSNVLTRDSSLSENDVINNTISELKTLFDLSDSRYDEMYDGDNIKTNYQKEVHEIQKLLNALTLPTSVLQIKDEINKTLKLYTNLDEDADEGYDGEDNITDRNFDLNAENTGGFGSLSTAVKKYIAITTYESNLSEFFGFSTLDNVLSTITIQSAVNPKKVYDVLVKSCANQQRPSQVLAKMNAIKNELHEGKQFINKFFQEAELIFDSHGNVEKYNPDKYSLIQRIAKAFNLEYKNYVFTQIDITSKQFNTFNANQQDVHTKQTSVWKGNFISNKIRYGLNFENIIKEIEDLNNVIGSYNNTLSEKALNNYVDKYQVALEKFGISLSRGYLKYLLLTTNVIKDNPQGIYVSQFEDLVNTLGKTDGKFFIESLNQIIKSVREGVNPFERSIGLQNEELGNLGRILRIAKDNATFDENVYIVTLRNAEGKTIYPYQTPNYNSLAITRILSGDPSEGLEEPNVDYLENNFLDNNTNFHLLNTNNKITVDRIEGIKHASLSYDKANDAVKFTKSGDGVTYGSMTDRELALKQLALFADSSSDLKLRDEKGNVSRVIAARKMMFTIMEASNTADTITLPLHEVTTKNGQITNVFKDFIFDEIQREYNRIKNVTEGKYKSLYKNFNTGKKKRGTKFWENNNIFIGEKGQTIKKQLESLEITPNDVRDDIYNMINESFMNEFNDYLNKLNRLKIIEINKKGEINNVLLDPRYFGENGINNTNPFKEISDKNIKTNLLYFYLNTYMNSMSFNQLLQGDPALTLKDFRDWFKRARGSNATGANMLSFDENLNTPISVVTYAEIEDGEFNEPSYDKYAVASLDGKSDKMIARYDQEGNITSEWSKFITDHKTLRLANGFSEEEVNNEIKEFEKQGSIDYNDAQCDSTVEGFLHFKKLLGEMTPIGIEIYEKIKNGTFGKQKTKDQIKDWEYLKNNELMANSIKLVYYDGFTYIKMSVTLLSPEFTTRPDGTAKRGKELLHKKRIEMERKDVMLMGPPSMMKKLLKNPAQIKDGNLNIQNENIQFIDPLHLKLQQKNPSNKTNIKDPSQMMQIIASEQNRDVEVILPNGTKTKIGNVVDDYNNLLSERIDLAYKIAKQFLYPLQNDNPTLHKGRFVKMFKETLETSGASQQLMDLLKTDAQGEPVHNFNLEHIATQFEQQFNAYFNKVFVQKVPGYKTTLQSGYGYNVVVEKSTGRVIPSYEYDANPKKYDSDNYTTRSLAFDQPRIVNGNEIHRYSEIILPYHFAEQFNLKPGDEIPDVLAYMFGVRIPSQDKHSAMVLKVVDIMPPYYGSNAIFPHELIKLTGSDFDIDSFFIHRMDHYYKDGEFKAYGNNIDSKWDQFITYQYSNNKFFKKVLREIERHPDHKLLDKQDRIKLALKELGLPDSENDFNKSNIRTLGEINNDLLATKMILHTNPGINDLINKMPVSLKIMEDYLTNLGKILGYNSWEEIDKDYNPNSILGMLAAFTVNKAGQKAIGAAVNNTQVYSVLSQFGIKASYSEGKSPVLFDIGNKIISVGDIIKGNTLTEDQRRIADVLTTLTSSMTDNTKYGYNSKMNIDINSLSTLSFAVSTHIPFEVIADMLQNEYVIEYINRSQSFAIKTQSEIEASSPQLIMEQLLTELKSEIKKIDPYYSDSALKELGQSPITLTELRNNIVEFSPMRKEYRDGSDTLKEHLDNKKNKEYYESQYKILSAYSQLSTQGAQFTTFSQVIKLTKGVSSSDNQTSFKGDDEIVDNLAKLNLKLVKKGNGYDLNYIDSKVDMMYDFKDIIKNHPITWKNLTVFANKQELAKQTFITKTDFAKSVTDSAISNKKINLNKKQRSKFSSELRRNLNAYLILKALRHTESKNPESKLFKHNLNSLLYADIAAANNVSTLNEDQIRIKSEYPEFNDNIWLHQVNFIKDGNNIKASYNTFNKGSLGFERMIIADFNKLFRDPRTKDFAIKSFEYLIAHSALRFKNNSFVSILPEYMFVKLSKQINDFHNTLNNPNDLGFNAYFGQGVNEVKEEFLDNFFRDIHNQDFIIPLRYKKGKTLTIASLEETNKKGDNSIKVDNNQLIINPFINNSGVSLFHPDIENQQELETLKKNNLFVAFNKLQSLFDIKKILLKDGKSGTLFKFPKFISVGANLYKLKSYKEDFSKNELVNSNQEGEYWGLSANYDLVSKRGDKISGAIPYGRNNQENEEVNSFVLSQKYKDSQENSEDQDDDDDPLAAGANIPTPNNMISSSISNSPISSAQSFNVYAGTNENAELSNFATRPFNVSLEANGEYFSGKFNTVEGAFQAAKIFYTTSGRDSMSDSLFEYFQSATGSNAKKVGRNIQDVNIQDWDKDSSSIMKKLIKQSFQQNSKALETLLATGNATLTHTQDKGKWGTEFPKLLMEVREELNNSNNKDPEPTNLPPQTANNTISLLSTSGGNDVTKLKTNGYQFFTISEKAQDSFNIQEILMSVKKALSLPANASFDTVKESYTKLTDVEKIKEINKIFCK